MHTTGATPGHSALRRGRWSAPSATYFITLCTKDRKPGLTQQSLFKDLLRVAQQLKVEDVMYFRAMTLMPDHLHAVVRLGTQADIARGMRLFKGRGSVILRQHGLAWQKGAFFDHRIHPDEPLLPVFHYIFMNPYRADLLSGMERWEFFYCCDEDRAWYQPGQAGDIPHPVWLNL